MVKGVLPEQEVASSTVPATGPGGGPGDAAEVGYRDDFGWSRSCCSAACSGFEDRFRQADSWKDHGC